MNEAVHRSDRRRSETLQLASLVVALAVPCALAGCGDSSTPKQPAAPAASAATNSGSPFAPMPAVHANSLTPEQVDTFNRGVGLMGTFSFELAEEVFAALVMELGEGHPFARLAKRNLAIARLNQSADGSQERALELLEPLVAEDPTDVTSHYCIGLIKLFLGAPDEATAHFKVAADADARDAYAAFYMGQCLEFDGKPEDARRWYASAAELDPYLRSPLLALQRIASRAGDAAEAAKQLELFQRLADNPRAKLAEFKYTRMGRKAEACVPQVMRAPVPPKGEPFVTQRATIVGEPAFRGEERSDRASLTAADINGDGRIDLFGANALAEGRSLVLLANHDGEWQWSADHPLAATTNVRAALWGDVDSDGHLDAVLCQPNAVRLFLGDGAGGYRDVTATSGLAAEGFDLVDGLLVDLDHDGDLDLYLVNGRGPNEFFANDGTTGAPPHFKAIGASSGAAGNGRPSSGVIVQDIDGDRDADLLLLHDLPPHELLLNERLWRFAPPSAEGAAANPLLAERVVGGIAGDWNADGIASIVAASPQGTLFVVSRDRVTWTMARHESAQVGTEDDRSFACADVTGSGTPNLLWSEKADIAVAALDGSAVSRVPLPPGSGSILAWTVVQRGTAGPSVAVLTTRGLVMLDPSPNRGGYALVRFSGRTEPSQSMRSNPSGIGVLFAARVGERWVGGDTFRASTGRGQSLQPTAIGVGDATSVDFLSMEWSDGVFQSELDLPARSVTVVSETQRQISSCPVIFAWDGSTHRFVTDCLGVGGIGYLIAPGEYAPPRPWERVLLPRNCTPALRDGAFEFLLGEPMEEACYLDAARLVAYDLPAGWSMTIDERMGLAGPEPTGAPRFYRTAAQPTRVVDDRGVDGTKELSAADGRALPIATVDPRLIGYLTAPRTITIEFAEPIDRLPGQPTLVAHGWVEYPYCQTNFAAWQSGIASEAPDLEARGADGRWQRVLPSWGYPAGMPREMSLPLVGLPEGTTALRMTSNLEIYWDAIQVVGVEPCPEARRTEMPLLSASLRDGGFAARRPQPEKRPDYDSSRRLPLWDTRHQPGFYTAFGACTELVQTTDDSSAIFGPGEELTLRFRPIERETTASLNAGLTGGERRFILEVDGWCKDFDLFTRDGESLEPIPTRNGEPIAPASEAARLHARFNTRYRDGR